MATLPGICVLAIAAANLAAGVSVEHPWTKSGYGGPTPFRDGAYNGKDLLLLVTCGLFFLWLLDPSLRPWNHRALHTADELVSQRRRSRRRLWA